MSDTKASAEHEPQAKPDAPVEAEADAKPALRIITPSTTPEEVAAIVAVLASLGGGEPAPKKQRSLWATPTLRGIAHSGPGAWRASGLAR